MGHARDEHVAGGIGGASSGADVRADRQSAPFVRGRQAHEMCGGRGRRGLVEEEREVEHGHDSYSGGAGRHAAHRGGGHDLGNRGERKRVGRSFELKSQEVHVSHGA